MRLLIGRQEMSFIFRNFWSSINIACDIFMTRITESGMNVLIDPDG